MKNKFYQLQLFLLCLTAFVFPLYIKATSITLLVLFVLPFVFRSYRGTFVQHLKSPGTYLFLMPLLVALTGLINADQPATAFSNLEVYSSLFFFPFIFRTFNENPLKNKQQYIHSFFIFGILAAFFLCLGMAFINYFESFRKDYFFYSRLSSSIMSPNHLSNYVLWAIMLILTDLAGLSNNLVLYSAKVYKVVVLLLLMCFLFLLASKAAFIIFCLMMLSFMIFLIVKKIIPLWQSVILCIVLLMLGMYLYQTTNIKGRVMFAYKVIENPSPKQSSSQESTALRVSALNASKDIIREHFWFGVGTGDVQKTIVEYYQSHSKSGAYIHQTNPHNQYLFSWIMNGVAGIIAIMVMFVYLFATSVRRKNIEPLFWVIYMILLFATDDILTIQIGVVFFSFYTSLLLWSKPEINTPENNSNTA